jgi:tRNA pseudouridine synthase 10
VSAAVPGYRLCEHCLRRQSGPTGAFKVAVGSECFVCGGLLDRIPSMARKAARMARRYDFRTFSVGVSMPGGVQEKEDELRSDLKLKGSETIKSQAARLVAGLVSGGLDKRVDKMKPDLTLLVNFSDGEVTAASRPVYFYGRYTKPRGVSQRREPCHECRGVGCQRCRGTGFERKQSVEAQLRRKLAGFSHSERMTFTWLGSEDRESKVYPPGRPFLVEVKNPMQREFPRSFAARFRGGQVAVSSGRVLRSKPVRLPRFKFRTEILATSASKVGAVELAALEKAFRKALVRFERPNEKPAWKTVYRTSARARGKKLYIDAELDGGLPVKRFVDGERVSPSVSEVLKTEVRCRRFDICEVKETGKFELAEVARIQKEN